MRIPLLRPKPGLPKLDLEHASPKVPFAALLQPQRVSALADKPQRVSARSPEQPARPPANATARVSVRSAKREEHRDAPVPELDSATRTAVLLAPPALPHSPPPPVPAAPAPIDPTIAVTLVEQATFWGDGHRGLARLRFNGRARAGLANATITLEHDGESVRLRVDGAAELSEDLRERLASRGVDLSGES